MRDVSKFDKKREYETISDFLSSEKIDGLSQIKIGGEQILDIYTANLSKASEEKPILVCFSAAISRVPTHKAPFFSGLNIYEKTRLPFVAISDPTLLMSNDLKLAWYAGNQENTNLQKIIASILDHIAKARNTKLILFGVSGGGFSCLVQTKLLKCPVQAIIMNPQSSIIKYDKVVVFRYLKAAFPKLHARLNKFPFLRRFMFFQKLIFVLNKIIYNVERTEFSENKEILYLQNWSDGHNMGHAQPFFKHRKTKRIGGSAFCNENEKICIFLGEWGNGHVVPSKPALVDIVKSAASGQSAAQIARRLDNGEVEDHIKALIRPSWLGL